MPGWDTDDVSVDLNADLGESYGRWTLGDDSAMVEVVTSANIACGFHAGDPATLLAAAAVIALANPASAAPVNYVALGDSYTIGTSVAARRVAMAARRASPSGAAAVPLLP